MVYYSYSYYCQIHYHIGVCIIAPNLQDNINNQFGVNNFIMQ